MKAETHIKGPTRAFSNEFPTNSADFNILTIVYKREDKVWRGFVYPYGETTEAQTKEEALERIRSLTEAYREAVAEYDNPRHLVFAGIMDTLDREVLSWVIGNESLMKQIHSEEGRADSDVLYVEAHRH